MSNPIKARCALCGTEVHDEKGAKEPVLCSEECEELFNQSDGRGAGDVFDEDYGGVLGADGQVHSDADPGL